MATRRFTVTPLCMQEWSSCKGSKPGTRGYTCALWQLFHSLASRLPEQPASGAVWMATIKGFIKHFFQCAECASHFLRMAADGDALHVATKRDAILWAWRAHNKVSSRCWMPRPSWPVCGLCLAWCEPPGDCHLPAGQRQAGVGGGHGGHGRREGRGIPARPVAACAPLPQVPGPSRHTATKRGRRVGRAGSVRLLAAVLWDQQRGAGRVYSCGLWEAAQRTGQPAHGARQLGQRRTAVPRRLCSRVCQPAHDRAVCPCAAHVLADVMRDEAEIG